MKSSIGSLYKAATVWLASGLTLIVSLVAAIAGCSPSDKQAEQQAARPGQSDAVEVERPAPVAPPAAPTSATAKAAAALNDTRPPLAVAPFDAAQGKRYQLAWADYLGVPVEMTNSVGMKMVLVPPGEYGMGASERELPQSPRSENQAAKRGMFEDAASQESPKRRVTISSPFYLGKFEVTVEQFRRFVTETGYQTTAKVSGRGGLITGQGPDPSRLWDNPGFAQDDGHPVVHVSWNDASRYGEWLSAQEKSRYRLPRMAEWEYACRAGASTRFSCGDSSDSLQGVANLADQSFRREVDPEASWAAPWDDGYGYSSPVGSFRANAFGLHDMHGNIWEWMSDPYTPSEDDRQGGPAATGQSAAVGYHVRGGSFDNRVGDLRSSKQAAFGAGFAAGTVGFRMVCELDAPLGASVPLATNMAAVASRRLDGGDGAARQLEDQPPMPVAPFSPAEAQQHQQRWAAYVGLPVEFENSIGMKMVLIPPGEFLMGSTEEQIQDYLKEETERSKLDDWYFSQLPNEGPQHLVRLTGAFYLGAHEVTVGQFGRFAEDIVYETDAERDGRGGSGLIDGDWVEHPKFVWNGDPGFVQNEDHPVVNVSWNDATEFCRWLSHKESAAYALPSEAQWEYACRGGSLGKYGFGDDESLLDQYAWYGPNSGRESHPVGQKLANSFGLYDLLGNVRESCADWFASDYYRTSPTDNPAGPPTGGNRTYRGGSWNHAPEVCRSAYRNGRTPTSRSSVLGFRVVLVPSAQLNR